MEHRAAADLLKVPVDHAVDRGRVMHLAFMLAAMVGIFALYLALSPKNPLLSAARVLWPWSSIPVPTRVHIEEVRPGDGIVFNDDRQDISALVSGLRSGEEVVLIASTADGQVVDDRVIMTRSDDANHYRCELPPGSGGFQQDTSYRITAGDATSQEYKLEVHIAPTIGVDRIDYHFPAYTETADRTIKDQGDIKALEGTQVTIHATANLGIKEAKIDLGCAGLQLLSMTTTGTKATGQFKLALDADNSGKAQYSRYQILFTDTSGQRVRRPVQYQIDVDRDLPPEIRIEEPTQERVEVAEDGQLRIHVHANDPDFALRHVALQAERAGQNLGLPALLDRPKPEKALPIFDGDYIFQPAKLKLKAGDLVTYWAIAEDNKEPRPNHAETAHRTIQIVSAGQAGDKNSRTRPMAPMVKIKPAGASLIRATASGTKPSRPRATAPSKGESDKQDGDHASGDKTQDKGQDKSNDPAAWRRQRPEPAR